MITYYDNTYNREGGCFMIVVHVLLLSIYHIRKKQKARNPKKEEVLLRFSIESETPIIKY